MWTLQVSTGISGSLVTMVVTSVKLNAQVMTLQRGEFDDLNDSGGN